MKSIFIKYSVFNKTCIVLMCVFIVTLLISTSVAQNLLRAPESVVYDAQNNRYLASNYTTGHIVAIDSLGDHDYFVQNEYCKNGVHIEGNIIYAACIDRGVKGFDLTTEELVIHINIDGMINLNDITSDTSGNLYVSDVYGSKIYRIKISDYSYTTFVDCGSIPPNGLYFDKQRNRILVASYATPSPIQEINLEDSTITTIVNTGYYHLDGITQDNEGNIYFSTWQTNSVYMYDSLFSNPPELIFSNPNGAADIFYNKIKNELAIPVMWSNRIEFLQIPTSVDGKEETFTPARIELNQNYPNPFNSSTKISYVLPESGNVSIDVYNILGRKVSTLIDKRQTAGYKNVTWNSSDYSSGIYFYKLTTENKTLTKRMTLLK